MTQDQPNTDPRHQKRIQIMQQLFAQSFQDQDLAPDDPAQQVFDHKQELDELISQYAPERPLTEINKIDLAILRLIVFESKQKKTPKKVLIDEAVEIAKEFGSESSPKFVNGVLGKLFAEHL